MRISIGGELAVMPLHRKPNRWRRIALCSALALASAWFGGVTSALAASFGAGAIIEIIEPAQPTNFVSVASDPAGLITTSARLLVPEGEAYSAGNTTASISLSHATTLGGFGMGSGSVDSATGTIRLSSTASGDAITVSTAGFSETLTPLADGFHQYTLRVTGIATGDAGGSGAFFAVDDTVWLGTRGEVEADGCFSTLNGANSCDYVFDVPVTAGVPIRFSVAIVAAAVSSSLDLTRTATLRVTGVPFTSASGIFLTAVPEPGALPLLGLAWAGVGGWRGRRKDARRAG